ncbi:MAG: hypothetical protein KF912_01405 [Phycisphaeraceae bacterium]|nr:hypothetical protein [Phycisphaeraceae bacterium]
MNNEPTSDRPSPGVVHLAHTTPLSDAIQGRLTGRLDIALACDRAGLPPSIRELVLQTAQATRLWRVERADVAHELIAHFRDGIEAGRTPDELIAAFGESLVAARLIRRAKKQSRPLSWKLWILLWKSIGALLVLSILLYLILFIRYHTGSPVVKVNPIATLNAPALSIPTEERAWNRYKLAISAYTKPHDDLMLPGAQWPHIPADSPYRDLALATLEANRPALEHVHAAAAMPRLGYILSIQIEPDSPWANHGSEVSPIHDPDRPDNPPAIGILLPSLGEFRKFTHLLMLDSMLAREQHDAPRLALNIRTILGMAQHTRELPFLISDLVAIALATNACKELQETLHQSPDLLSEQDLASLAHSLAAFPRDSDEIVRYASEASIFDDLLQRIYTDDGRGNGRVTAKGMRLLHTITDEPDSPSARNMLDPISTAMLADRISMKREYERLMAEAIVAARKPLWTWTNDPGEQIDASVSDFVWRQRYAIIGSLIAAVGKAAASEHRYTQTRDATLVAIAITLSKRRTGEYPASLEGLVPDLLPAIPPDIFDGNPLRYTLIDGSPVIYSVGVDRKDDGGRSPKNPGSLRVSVWLSGEQATALMASPNRATIDGDWVLFPPLPPTPHTPPPADN